MQIQWILGAMLVLGICISLPIEAKRLRLRPMSAREVYRVLREAGREDAIPEGRVITQGIAAASGFALGLTKGIGGSLLVDLATSNATQQWLNNMNFTMPDFNFTMPTFNLSSLWGGGGSGGSGGTIQMTEQEICFSSRSLNQIDEEDDELQGRQTGVTTPPTSPTVTPTGTPTVTNTPTPTSTGVTTNPTTSTTTTGGGTNTGTNTGGGTVDGTGSGTSNTGGTGTGTSTSTTTSDADQPAMNCIVIQKPMKVRRRRAIRRN